MSECRKVQPVVDTFVDGELSAERVLETQEHLARCSSCHERVSLSQAIHMSTRRAVRDACEVSSSFEDRVRASLAAERAREEAAALEQEKRSQAERGRPLPWRTVVPVAAAAAIALAFASNKTESKKALGQTELTQAQAGIAPQMNEEAVLEELIRMHAASPAPAVTEPTGVGLLEREVGLPVKLQPGLNHYGASWHGASVVPVRNEPAASLLYQLDGHRLTVYVFDAERVPLRLARELKPRVVRDRPVFVGTKSGYSIAAIENRGVGYAIATDLPPLESAELVASIH